MGQVDAPAVLTRVRGVRHAEQRHRARVGLDKDVPFSTVPMVDHSRVEVGVLFLQCVLDAFRGL